MLSAVALLPEEQLEYARQEMLQTLPSDEADEINAFFDAVASADALTPDQIDMGFADIVVSKAAHDAAEHELLIEREGIWLELDELNRTNPMLHLQRRNNP